MDNGPAYKYATNRIVQYAKEVGAEIIVGPEARGFIIGCPVAYALEIGFAPVRKPGKLPREVISADYGLEYGTDTLTMHKDAVSQVKVLICDDLLATGGTVEATVRLIEQLGGEVVGAAFLIELTELESSEKLTAFRLKH